MNTSISAVLIPIRVNVKNYPFMYIILRELYTIGSKVTKMAIKVDRIRHARINKDIP